MSDNEITDMWRAVRKASQTARAQNRSQSADILREEAIVFITRNEGAHLIVEGTEGFIDFWPGTGRWNDRRGTKGFGVKNLIKHIKG